MSAQRLPCHVRTENPRVPSSILGPPPHNTHNCFEDLPSSQVTSQKVRVDPKKFGTSETLCAMRIEHESDHTDTAHPGRSKERAGRPTVGDHQATGRAHPGAQRRNCSSQGSESKAENSTQPVGTAREEQASEPRENAPVQRRDERPRSL